MGDGSGSVSNASSLFLRNRGDWRSTEPSGFGPEYRVVAQAATLALLHAPFSQWFSFFVSTLEALGVSQVTTPMQRVQPSPTTALQLYSCTGTAGLLEGSGVASR